VGNIRLVGVDEEEIERSPAFAGDLRQRVERGPDAHFDDGGEIRAGQVRARDLGVLRVGLEGDDFAAWGERPRQPDRAVTAERPNLEDRPRAVYPRKQMQ
jgi:hypothetical protein